MTEFVPGIQLSESVGEGHSGSTESLGESNIENLDNNGINNDDEQAIQGAADNDAVNIEDVIDTTIDPDFGNDNGAVNGDDCVESNYYVDNTNDDGQETNAEYSEQQIDEKLYNIRKEISAKFLDGPGMTNNKFIAYQKLGVPDGSYFFAATILGDQFGEGDCTSLIEFGDMFEGLVFLICAHSTQIDDLQFIFIKQSWLEKCPQTDETGGDFIGATGANIMNYYCFII